MRLCLFSGRRFEETFENSQRRKVKQMQRMWQPYTSRLRLMSGPCRHSMCAASGAHAAPVHIPVRCLCQTTVWSISPRHSMLSCLATIHTLCMSAAQHLLRHRQLQLPLLCLSSLLQVSSVTVPLNYPRSRMVAPPKSHQSSPLSVSSLTKVTSVKSLLTMSQGVSEQHHF